jgi:hypothetical protein
MYGYFATPALQMHLHRSLCLRHSAFSGRSYAGVALEDLMAQFPKAPHGSLENNLPPASLDWGQLLGLALRKLAGLPEMEGGPLQN